MPFFRVLCFGLFGIGIIKEDRKMWNLMFFIESLALGAGLAMDAFSVSMADGLNEPSMKRGKVLGIASVFAGFQAAMPLIGWICVHTLLQYFKAFEPFIPYIALLLLVYIGGNMLREGIKPGEEGGEGTSLGVSALLLQGVATSIDALSVGFTIAEYDLPMALVSALIIGVMTFGICTAGLYIGKKFGNKLAGKAQIFGGVILIAIGLEIFITSFF